MERVRLGRACGFSDTSQRSRNNLLDLLRAIPVKVGWLRSLSRLQCCYPCPKLAVTNINKRIKFAIIIVLDSLKQRGTCRMSQSSKSMLE